MPSRRDVLRLGAVTSFASLGLGAGPAAHSLTRVRTALLPPERIPVPYTAAFRRPPELLPYATGFDGGDPARPYAKYALTQKLGQAEIVPGLSTTVAGYNGMFPGPTIRVAQGTRTEVRIRNAFPAQGLLHPQGFNTVTHLHGSASLPQYDGYANDFTAPGYVKNYHYANWQAARTLWYHDHNHHVTAQNVYSGLAGFYLLSDAHEQAQLPQGEYDVPLLVSDASFNDDGTLAYNDLDHDGFYGDVILVNGVPWPTMTVKPRVYRFRILCGSVSRSYRPTLSTGDPVYIVATDGGLVPVVQAVKSWRHGAAERYEVLIDFSRYTPGQSIELRNLSNKNNINFTHTNKIMRFLVVPDSGPATSNTIPTTLDDGGAVNAGRGGVATMSLTPEMATVKRQLTLGHANGEWTINLETWDDVENSGFRRLFANPNPYDIEEWTIVNASGGWYHPTHIHLTDGKIIGRNTNGGKPFAWENGPKDVFYAGENEAIRVLMQFDTGPHAGAGGRYMIHCHNLPHEDHDMMVQFAVGDLENNNPMTADPPILDPLPAGAFPPVYAVGFPGSPPPPPAPADTVAPTITSTTPRMGATGVSRTADLKVVFSEAVTGISASTVRLARASDGALVATSLALDVTATVLTINPSITLLAGTRYRIALIGGTGAVRDLAGNPLVSTSGTFTTGAM